MHRDLSVWTQPFVTSQSPDSLSALRTRNGDEFATRIYRAEYIGQLPARHKAPFLILSGFGCRDCDANRSIYIISPDDGPMGDEGEQRRFSYPGALTSWGPGIPEGTAIERSRLF
jgi:hypothetical protein